MAENSEDSCVGSPSRVGVRALKPSAFASASLCTQTLVLLCGVYAGLVGPLALEVPAVVLEGNATVG